MLVAFFKSQPVTNFFCEQPQQKSLALLAHFFFEFDFFFNNVPVGSESVAALQAVEDHLNGKTINCYNSQKKEVNIGKT